MPLLEAPNATLEAHLPADRGSHRRSEDSKVVALILVALALLVVNIVPTLSVGFFQDDFRLMDDTQAWAWNLSQAIEQKGYTLGFRPLNMLQHTVLWNLLGENAVAHRLIRFVVHLAFGGLLVYGAFLLGGSKLHAAVVLLFYFSSTVTSTTVYHWVMFTPSDILSLSTLILTFAGIRNGWRPATLGLSAAALAALAVYTKENGIAASGSVLLMLVCFWNRLTPRHRAWLGASQLLLLLVYLRFYLVFSADKWMTISEFSAVEAQNQTWEVLKGIVISFMAPFSAIYLSMRNTGLDVAAALGFVLLAAAGVAWLLWNSYGQSLEELIRALRSRLALAVVIAVLIIGFLVPYLPGRWFEMRMVVATFAMGTLLWGMIVGDGLAAYGWQQSQSDRRMGHSLALGIVVLVAALAAGTPLSANIRSKEETASALRQVVREAQARGIMDVCLIGFKNKGSLLRAGNARGLIGYESRRRLAVHEFATVTDITPTLQCVAVTYDETLMSPAPLAIRWPQADRTDAPSPSYP